MVETPKPLLAEIDAALAKTEGRDVAIAAAMASIADRLPHYNWVGVYALEGQTLVLGPFVGAATDHTRIPVGRGVCGTAVAEERNQVIEDVRRLDNYLACSVETRSEIVVLIHEPGTGRILGQIDADGHAVGAFDASDEAFLEQVAARLALRWESLTGRLVSLQVGKPRRTPLASGRVWESAIFKEGVAARVPLRRENLDGDVQANRKYHGGPDKAVCTYSVEHYPAWRALLDRPMPHGAFGENFTWEGLTEDRVCVGDIFTVGTARVQVSQPRQPCNNVSRRWESADLPRRMEETGHTGSYLRVLQEGEVGAGDTLTLRERPHPGWTLLRANALMYAPDADPSEVAALRSLTALSAEWQRILGRKLSRGQ